MDRAQLSKSERKNMDTCLRRLKHELLCMKEAGDGLQAQMTSMMSSLQELKLLQVQTALDRLDLSGGGQPRPAAPPSSSSSSSSSSARPRTPSPPSAPPQVQRSPSSSSTLENQSPPPQLATPPQLAPPPQPDLCAPRLLSQAPPPAPSGPTPLDLDLPGLLYSLSREGPSLDSDPASDANVADDDDPSDWTCSLMSRSRSRTPLVLGDHSVLAELVGSWLDLPEEGGGGGEGEGEEPGEEEAEPSRRLSRSQEVLRRLSLTAGLLRRLVRGGVRPDRDKLLKERPAWEEPGWGEGAGPGWGAEPPLSKRPGKKAAGASAKKARGGFYLPSWAGGGGPGKKQGKDRPRPPAPPPPADAGPAPQPKRRPRPHAADAVEAEPLGRFSGSEENEGGGTHTVFDYNTAVWV